MWKCTRKFWCITACGDTQFNVNSHMTKSVFQWTRICTVLSELPHVEIHKSMCKSAPAEIRFSPCGNSHEIVHFRIWKYAKNCGFPNLRKYSFFGVFPHAEIWAGKWISACQFTSGFMNFRGEKRAGIHDFFFFFDFPMRKYTRKCEFPRAEIHAERCITICGNTLNQVQKIVHEPLNQVRWPDGSIDETFLIDRLFDRLNINQWLIVVYPSCKRARNSHRLLLICCIPITKLNSLVIKGALDKQKKVEIFI